ncbi:hypothetical protein PSECIP111951_01792 [Pseudoalteromonas holothuriae]|uniref:Lipoprotein n=1 Tax=Pseudoalteromonas holothuriae TaxID=2963714 RepID=A0ABM9GHK2_9GAMM|nr:hypothetical protein [Pseudoalteromonas sp. CIP111951]CAH9058054.1 hypothetical protein PSECIP111951_01792 [Pseudoalteromonas sp. CIP111951]
MKSLTISIIMLSTLSACGGGSEQGQSQVQNTQISNEATAPSSAAQDDNNSENQSSISLANLSIAPNFNLETNVQVNIQVASNLVMQRAYINVCKATAQEISYSDCYYQGPLTQDGLNTMIELPYQNIELTAAIWVYDPLTSPQIYQWQFDTNTASQIFTIK